ncbi:MAG TPA: ceramide glucosyltransferase [Methylovirgula sp.]|nr:ceramide glucosyltransferase [Methylovirgula sp.]
MTFGYGVGLVCLILVILNFISVGIAIRRAKPRKTPLPPRPDAPPVSLVRPVCGIDNFCEETLGSSFRLDYPHYEVIFCVARASDPVVPIVERLIAAHPNVAARLIIGDEKVSANPKLNNCVRGWDAARYDWIILADSNVLMPRDYIQRLFASWGPKTGLVCSMPQGSHPKNIWAEFEIAFLNTYQARWQYAADGTGTGFAQGKNMLWRRDVLEAGGGIRALAAEIAEDAASTKVVRRAGLKINLVDSPFQQPLGRRTFQDVWHRQIRWARMRRKTFPAYYLPEILAGCATPALVGSYAADLIGWNVPLTAGLVLLSLYCAETILAFANKWYFSWRLPLLFLLRDLMQPAIYLDAWLMDDFVWRGTAMTVSEEEKPST